MNLSHMQGFITAGNVLSRTVVEPHPCFFTVQVGHCAALTVRAVFREIHIRVTVYGKHPCVVPAETAVFHGHAEILKNICRDFYSVHALCNNFKYTCLQYDFGILCVYNIRKSLRFCKMDVIILNHVPDAGCATDKFHPKTGNGTQVIFQGIGVIQIVCRDCTGEIAFQHLAAHISVKFKIKFHCVLRFLDL